ncbi:MAG: hypothetical protein J3Q66DRAFT_398527 [Benniella sp.]|nr:MAG: hypothetical protein J3Q66DRAFT_398527 [Benniella sp.]
MKSFEVFVGEDPHSLPDFDTQFAGLQDWNVNRHRVDDHIESNQQIRPRTKKPEVSSEGWITLDADRYRIEVLVYMIDDEFTRNLFTADEWSEVCDTNWNPSPEPTPPVMGIQSSPLKTSQTESFWRLNVFGLVNSLFRDIQDLEIVHGEVTSVDTAERRNEVRSLPADGAWKGSKWTTGAWASAFDHRRARSWQQILIGYEDHKRTARRSQSRLWGLNVTTRSRVDCRWYYTFR